MKFHRHAAEPTTRMRARGATPGLKSDEVSRHAVRLVTVARDRDEVGIAPFSALAARLRAGDIVVVNDAATLPGSLRARTARGEPVELRLSRPPDGERLHAIAFGAGDYRTRTEDRPPPPPLASGDTIYIGSLALVLASVAGRRVELVARGASEDQLWQALYAAGRPVQYAHRAEPLALWTVQTAYAARPWAAEMPSAGRPLTWDTLLALRRGGVAIARLTHAAGLSSTGDAALDRALPWPERYDVPQATVDAIAAAHAGGGRVIAVGTTVVRALEASQLRAGTGIATLRLDASYPLRVVDGIVSGLHAPGESHFELLQAFAPRERLVRAIELAASHGLSAHELGDSCLIL